MKIYHYTSIETLALILNTKKIRFNRLDFVDDLEESLYGSGPTGIKLGQYTFVSCWTKDSKENIARWNMYTKNKGVRIGLDADIRVCWQLVRKFRKIRPNSIIPRYGDRFDYAAPEEMAALLYPCKQLYCCHEDFCCHAEWKTVGIVICNCWLYTLLFVNFFAVLRKMCKFANE